jgi:hypothetical protein
VEVSRCAEHEGEKIVVFGTEDGVGFESGGGEGGCGCRENGSFC